MQEKTVDTGRVEMIRSIAVTFAGVMLCKDRDQVIGADGCSLTRSEITEVAVKMSVQLDQLTRNLLLE